MRTTRRAAALRLPLVACAALAGAFLVGCSAEGQAGGVDILGGGDGEGAASWPSSVPRPDLTLVEETDLLIAYSATYALAGGTTDAYVAELESDGFALQGQSSYSDGTHVVLLEVEADRLYVTITDA